MIFGKVRMIASQTGRGQHSSFITQFHNRRQHSFHINVHTIGILNSSFWIMWEKMSLLNAITTLFYNSMDGAAGGPNTWSAAGVLQDAFTSRNDKLESTDVVICLLMPSWTSPWTGYRCSIHLLWPQGKSMWPCSAQSLWTPWGIHCHFSSVVRPQVV